MKIVYFDHNVYIKCLDNTQLCEKIIKWRDEKEITVLYSPAHIEEVYRVASDKNSIYRCKMLDLLNLFEIITQNKEAFPSEEGGVRIENEKPEVCYARCKSIDTRNRVEEDSLKRFMIDTAHYKKMLSEDKQNRSISTLSALDVWDNTVVKGLIDDWNNNKDDYILKYNNSIDIIMLKLIGLDRSLPMDFMFKENSFEERLKYSHKEIEFTIEFLMRVLNFCGYCAEKSEKTAISSTHDVSHCIYATVADSLVTMDERFAKKSKAVYTYLGVNTDVIYCRDLDAINTWIEQKT